MRPKGSGNLKSTSARKHDGLSEKMEETEEVKKRRSSSSSR